MARRSDAPPVRRRMRSSRYPCLLVAAPVHFSGMPGRPGAQRASAPWRRLCRRLSSICPVCGRGEGSGGRRLRLVHSAQRQFQWRSWGAISLGSDGVKWFHGESLVPLRDAPFRPASPRTERVLQKKGPAPCHLAGTGPELCGREEARLERNFAVIHRRGGLGGRHGLAVHRRRAVAVRLV